MNEGPQLPRADQAEPGGGGPREGGEKQPHEEQERVGVGSARGGGGDRGGGERPRGDGERVTALPPRRSP